MATGREMYLTQRIGEYLVCAELCRQGFIATPFAGNVPEFDIVAINSKFKTQHIQVKTIKGGQWQLRADRFLDISITADKKQIINGKKKIQDANLICIFVKLISREKDEFYIFKLADLQNILLESHSKWLTEHGLKRPRNPESMHTSVSTAMLSDYLDKWELLKI